MNMSRFASISGNTLENQHITNRIRFLNNINNNINININNNSISCNYNKMKILFLIIITIIMSLSNYFYNISNNNSNLVEDEPRTILSLFENKILKMNSPLNDKKKLRYLIQEDKKNEDNNSDDDNIIINDIINNNINISTIINKTSNFNETNDYKNIKDDIERIQSILKRNIKKKLFNDLQKYKFKCTWKSIKIGNNSDLYKIGDSTSGDGIFTITKKIKILQEYFVLTMKNKEDKYIDNWIIHSSLTDLENIIINKNITNNTFEIKGNFQTLLYKGEFFNILNEENPEICQMNIHISFPLKDQKYLGNNSIEVQNFYNYETIKLNPNNFSMIMESTCGLNFVIKANIYQKEVEQKIIKDKIDLYTLITIITSLLYMIGVYCVIFNIKQYECTLSTISTDCFTINPIWNTYICIFNIFLSFQINIDYPYFPLLVFFHVIKLIFFDLWFLSIYWKLRRMQLNNTFRNQKLRFYLFYYLSFFIFSIFIKSFFMNYIFMMMLCILLWTPQIIFNIQKNNKYGYPFIYIFSSTLDKLIYPFYFRGIKDNFLETKNNYFIVIIMILFVLFTIIILCMQMLKGPRFMLSISYNQSKFDFYKNKEELILKRSNIGSEECVICLGLIFGSESDTIIEMEDKSIIKDKAEEEKKYDDEKKEENNLSYNDTCSSDSSTNSEGEKLEENEIINNELNFQNVGLILNNRNNNNKQDNISNYHNKNNTNNKIKNHSDNIKLVEEELVENIKGNKNISNNSVKNEKQIHCSHKFKNTIKNVLLVFKIIFYENFFSFYKKSPNLLGKLYMFTPCSHAFHSKCLEKWLEYKKECPNCRTSMEEYL